MTLAKVACKLTETGENSGENNFTFSLKSENAFRSNSLALAIIHLQHLLLGKDTTYSICAKHQRALLACKG